MPLSSKSPRPAGSPLKVQWVAIYFALHIPLAFLLSRFWWAAVLHALATAVVGFSLAGAGTRRVIQVAYVGAYIVGAEVLWRMTKGIVVWEYGKYITSAIFLLAIMRHRMFRPPLLPIFYFGLLVCSIPLALVTAFPDETKATVSFYMSGPFSLMVCAWFFSHVRLTEAQTQRMLIVLSGPVLSIAVLALFNGLTAEHLEFGTHSNKITSGGFAPNQVSAILGLGAFAVLFCLLRGGLQPFARLLLFCVMLLLAVQSALTFSRGGLYVAGGAALAASLYMARDRRARLRLALLAGLVILLSQLVVMPLLHAYTKGALEARFKSTKLTGRETLAQLEIELWLENPLFGVGPGMGKYHREPLGAGSHTEYTRMLSEHGLFGLFAMLLLGLAGWQSLGRARGVTGKALSASSICWSLLFMANVAMRLVAPSFMFGLSCATIAPAEERADIRLRRRRVVGPAPVPARRWLADANGALRQA